LAPRRQIKDTLLLMKKNKWTFLVTIELESATGGLTGRK
jgi:hypothetical protein